MGFRVLSIDDCLVRWTGLCHFAVSRLSFAVKICIYINGNLNARPTVAKFEKFNNNNLPKVNVAMILNVIFFYYNNQPGQVFFL